MFFQKKPSGCLTGCYLKTVEIYTVEANTWRQGTDLPHKIGSFAASLPYEDTFITAGGYESKTIYKVVIKRKKLEYFTDFCFSMRGKLKDGLYLVRWIMATAVLWLCWLMWNCFLSAPRIPNG